MRPVFLRALKPAAAAIGVVAVSAIGLASAGSIAHAGPLDDGPLGKQYCSIYRGNSQYSGGGISWELPAGAGAAIGGDEGFACGLLRVDGPKKHRVERFEFGDGDSLLVLDGNFGLWVNIWPD